MKMLKKLAIFIFRIVLMSFATYVASAGFWAIAGITAPNLPDNPIDTLGKLALISHWLSFIVTLYLVIIMDEISIKKKKLIMLTYFIFQLSGSYIILSDLNVFFINPIFISAVKGYTVLWTVYFVSIFLRGKSQILRISENLVTRDTAS